MNPTERILKWFKSGHLEIGPGAVSDACAILAHSMADTLPPSAELTAGLRKLLEAKDCFVRARIEAGEERGEQ